VALEEEVGDFGDDVGVGGGDLHGFGAALHVHDDDAAIAIAGEGFHLWVGGQAADIIEDMGAGVEGGMGDSGFHGIDAEEGIGDLFAQAVDDGEDSADFLVSVDWGGAWAGAFAADVDDVSAFGGEFDAADDGGLGIEPLAAIGEGVRGDIEDAHDGGAVSQVERVLTAAPDERHG